MKALRVLCTSSTCIDNLEFTGLTPAHITVTESRSGCCRLRCIPSGSLSPPVIRAFSAPSSVCKGGLGYYSACIRIISESLLS